MRSLLPLVLLAAPALSSHAARDHRSRQIDVKARQADNLNIPSVNPTAVPLPQVTSGQNEEFKTIPLAASPTAGAVPTGIPGAPPLPDVSNISPKDYPDSDSVPPTDSPQVAEWMEEVKNSGVKIPDFAPTKEGGCQANPEAVADTSRCWWSCGGCTAPEDISDCPNAMDWGLTYDDGPQIATPNLLEYLDEHDLKATFFVLGSRATWYPYTLQAEYLAGHQIAIHTWSHSTPLTELTNEQVVAELGWARKAVKDVLGVSPRYMRPPFGDIDARVRALSLGLGMIPVMWTHAASGEVWDTKDFNIHTGTPVTEVLSDWQKVVDTAPTLKSGVVVLQHDMWPETVQVATGYIQPSALKQGFKMQPVISCLGQPLGNSYLETFDGKAGNTGGSSKPPVGSGSSSTPKPTGNSTNQVVNKPEETAGNGASNVGAGSAVFPMALGVVFGLAALVF